MDYEDQYGFVRPLLEAGEYILWKGHPEKGCLVTPADVMMIPFSIIWCGFAVFWEVSAISNGAPWFFALFGLPFIAVGLYITVGRFLHTAFLRKRTFYVITNRNIYRSRNGRIDLLSAATMPPAYMDFNKKGYMTVRFGTPVRYRTKGYVATPADHFVLENIADVAAVKQALSNMEK